MGFASNDDSDPFYEMMKAPANETPSQATARLKRELDAQNISDQIDEEIRNHRAQLKKEKNIIKVLLLGQAESGKSTTLKNFRMRYAQPDWERERNGWRSVVQFNVVCSIITILSVVDAEINGDPPEQEDDTETRVSIDGDEARPPTGDPVGFSDEQKLVCIRLGPLRAVEMELKRRLGASVDTSPSHLPTYATPFDRPSPSRIPRRLGDELAVRCWNDIMDLDRNDEAGELDSATVTIASCKNDMKALWRDQSVQRALARRKIRLPDSAGFFLNELDRIATRNYEVSDDDIVRARLRTVGIQEYRIRIKSGAWDGPRTNGAWEWRIFDVGGCRTTRHAWVPFFENTNVIVFLCPVSCFDERLEEDSNVNRLEDSINLWRSICSSKLLSKTQLILFMNKCDLLKRKLKRGIQVNKYLLTYGDRPNEVMAVVKYLRDKFKESLRTHSHETRTCSIFPTTLTDTKATAKTLESVRDGILRVHLESSQLI